MEELKTIYDLVARAAQKWPGKVHLREKAGKEIIDKTYSDLFTDCRKVASFLKPDAHAGLIGPSSIAYITCLLGTMMHGNIAVPIDPMLTPEEIIDELNRADVTVLFYDARLSKLIPVLKQALPGIQDYVCFSETEDTNCLKHILETCEPAAPAEINPEQTACILYTSGTTGVSKGVMLSHGNLIDNAMCCDDEGDDSSIMLSVLPLHHAYCLTCDLLLSLRYGVTLCLNDSMMHIPQNIRLFRPTAMLVVPLIAETLYRRIQAAVKATPGLTIKEAGRALFGDQLTVLFCGGAYLPPEITEAYKEMGIPLTQGYGMTECSPRISSSSLKDPSLGLDVGRVVKGCKVEIRDGEIIVKSPSVMQGYYKNEAATKEMFTDDGWLKTGDLGYIEDERIYITGRKKNLIILSNGENISPEQLENYYAGADWLQEILVYTEDGKITAEAYPYPEYREAAEELFRKTTDEINRKVPPPRRITRLRLRDKEFDKTSSRKIRRQQKGEKGRLLP